jgi:tRNA 2-selenouridine synthase
MERIYTSLQSILDSGFDTIIDVRSPSEFALDHIAGAINLPVLSDLERAEVGTIYTQDSRFRARKIGAAHIFTNTAAHVAGPLAQYDGSWRPLVYCWRGGQRSGSFGYLLEQIGWRAEVIQGGYRAYRALVHDVLYSEPVSHRIVLLDGNTGTAKTEILHRMAALGHQVIDLEGLAGHRGSLLGGIGPQPSQKAFESEIAGQLCRMDPNRPILIEAESSKIGERLIPPMLWSAMRAAPRIEITAPVAARAVYLARIYDDLWQDDLELLRLLEPLHSIRGDAVVARWRAKIAEADKIGLACSLMTDHYDPAYQKSRAVRGSKIMSSIHTDGLEDTDLTRVTDALSEALAKI